MKTYLIMALNTLVVLAFGQSRDTVFTVKSPVSSIRIGPEVDVLYKDYTKKFRVLKSATAKVDTIMFSEGTVQYRDSFICLRPTKAGTAILKIYEKLVNGKRALAFVKEFKVQQFVEPKPNLDGVSNDSAIHKIKVIAQGYVNVPMNEDVSLKRIGYPVLGFELTVADKGKVETLKASGNRLTYQMRDRIDNMKDGNVIDIGNIMYRIDADTFTVKQPLRVYLINDGINKF